MKKIFIFNRPSAIWIPWLGTLADWVKEKLGFEVILPGAEIPSDADLILNYSHSPNVAKLPKRIKVITWVSDAHVHFRNGVPDEKLLMAAFAVWERSDLIMSASNEYFRNQYPQFADKLVWLATSCFVPHKGYANLPFNENPQMRCLLSGCANLLYYPLRHHVVRRCQKYKPHERLIDIVSKTPKGKGRWKYVEDIYAKWLNQYFCCVTSASIFRYAVMKYSEIPAAGSLLLAEDVSDVRKMGFIPGKHFVAITKENVMSQIKSCLRHPEKYEGVRREGMEFARANRTVFNVFEDLKKIIQDFA